MDPRFRTIHPATIQDSIEDDQARQLVNDAMNDQGHTGVMGRDGDMVEVMRTIAH